MKVNKWLLLLLVVSAALNISLMSFSRFLAGQDCAWAVFWAKQYLHYGQFDRAQLLTVGDIPSNTNTPLLHLFLAGVSWLTGVDSIYVVAPITVVFSSFITVLIYYLAKLMTKNNLASLISAFVISFSDRMFTYFALPGYAYQNLFGDVFLLASVYALIRFFQDLKLKWIGCFGVLASMLLFVHHLSFFILFFSCLVILVYFAVFQRKKVLELLKEKLKLSAFVGVVSFIGLLLVSVRFMRAEMIPFKVILGDFYSIFTYWSWAQLAELFFVIIGVLAVSLVFRARRQNKFFYLALMWFATIYFLCFNCFTGFVTPARRIAFYLIYPGCLTLGIFVSSFKQRRKQLAVSLILLSLVSPISTTQYMRNYVFGNVKRGANGEFFEAFQLISWVERNMYFEDVILVDYATSTTLENVRMSGRLIAERGSNIEGTAVDWEQVLSDDYMNRYLCKLDLDLIFTSQNSSLVKQLLTEYGFSYVITYKKNDLNYPFLEVLYETQNFFIKEVR